MESTEERLVELELRYTHLEALVEQLNGVIVEQQRDIAQLAHTIRELRASAPGESLREGGAPADDRPPHY
jgi:SlyX protein